MSLEDLEPMGRAFLPRVLWEFVETGVEGNLSREENRRVFEDVWFVPRVLKDVRDRRIEKDLHGKTYAAPFGIAPMGASALFGFEADLNFARAAKEANIPYIMSGSAVIPMEKIIEANPDVAFQAYVESSREAIEALVGRVERAGFRHLVVTVDVPVAGNRGGNMRAGFNYPIKPSASLAIDGLTHPRWLWNVFLRTLRTTGMPHLENLGAGRGIPMLSFNAPPRVNAREGLDWEDIAWLRDRWKGRLTIKGVLSAEDAVLAGKAGLDGIIVSNHGGRQLDGTAAPLRVLPEIVAAKPGIPIMFDSGIRRGTDVLKALALGADFVFLGRPFLLAAALFEKPGVLHAAEILKSEIYRNMAILGLTDYDDLASRVVTGRGLVR
jgi:L-lactate dehydrogenase (cytochrome)